MPSFVDLDGLRTFKEHLNLSGGDGLLPIVKVTSESGNTVTMSKDDVTLTATEDNGTWEFNVPSYGDWMITATDSVNNLTRTKTVTVDAVKLYEISCNAIARYGYRISKTESDPYKSVEYILDAEGFTPAHMDFSNGTFDYGSWADVWFVKDNKPCAMNNRGEIEFYLDPNDYNYNEDGEPSYIEELVGAYFMAQFPLVWIKRYEDSNYYYEIVSNIQYDENYKAYAHTDEDGDIKDYFYHSIFPASIYYDTAITEFNSTPAGNLTAAQQRSSLQFLGTNWRLTSWSQYQLIRTLLILIGKSTDTQAVFGNGNEDGELLQTGTLADKGQFFGYNDFTHQVKVFHVEDFWGNYWIRLEGLLKQGTGIFYKMTPDYSFTDKTIFRSSFAVALSTISASPINAMFVNNSWGMFPMKATGSTSTYFCDLLWWNTSGNLCSANLVGRKGTRYSQTGGAGIFALDISNTPNYSADDLGFFITYF